MLYDTAHKTGFLYNALNNESKKKRKAINAIDLSNGEENFSEEAKEEISKFFKRCVPNDRKEVEKKLAETKTFRRNLILDDFKRYQTFWKFYFHMPDLVSEEEKKLTRGRKKYKYIKLL